MLIARAFLGICLFLLLGWMLGGCKRKLELRTILGGIALQVVLAWFVLKTDAGAACLDGLGSCATRFLGFAKDGSRMVFGSLADPDGASGFIFAFTGLITIIFFAAVMGLLYHLGVMQVLVWSIARVMRFTMRVSGAEALAMAANVFLGPTEAPIAIKPYVSKMTRAELSSLLVGGYATVAGSVYGAYIGFLGERYAGHILAASFMSAPAAFVLSRLLVPETEVASTAGHIPLRIERTSVNALDAIADGTTTGLKLFWNVAAMLIAFVSIVAALNFLLSGISVGAEPLTLQRMFGWVFSPLAWAIGAEWADCSTFGSLLGTKLALNEFVAFQALGSLEDGALSRRASIMASYALCGFANFSTVGITIGGMVLLAPERRVDVAKLGMRAMFAATLANCMTATIAGGFLDE
ncbi:MAG: NupC/NupG family nucleoside CNT transporter [Planctomycetes bacterium]|nr:NupC/NupG family nucleoside CNT transporter [Planctomycetota bacterium]